MYRRDKDIYSNKNVIDTMYKLVKMKNRVQAYNKKTFPDSDCR